MNNKVFIIGMLLIVFILFFHFPIYAGPTSEQVNKPAFNTDHTLQENVENNHRQTSLIFIENVGQFDECARFQIQGGNGTIWLTKDAIWITYIEQAVETIDESSVTKYDTLKSSLNDLEKQASHQKAGVNLKLSFVGANPSPTLEPFDRLETLVNYYLGDDPSKWSSNTPVWGGVRYINIYPGVDLEITGEDGQWNWRLVGRMDLNDIRLRVEGANNLELIGTRLDISTVAGYFTLPLVHIDELPSGNQPIISLQSRLEESTTFEVTSPFSNSESTGSFKPLSSSPQDNISDLIFSTFIGGSNDDIGSSMVVDKNDNIIISGKTASTNFPKTAGSFDGSYSGSNDIFVTKLSSDGSQLIFSTLIGGSNRENVTGLTLDPSGYIIVLGHTISSDFPTTSGAFDRNYSSLDDIVVFKLAANTGSAQFSTYLGGKNDERCYYPVLLDNVGNIIIAGMTYSPDFYSTAGAFDTSINGNGDAFILKLSSNGKSLLFSTFIGGGDLEDRIAMALDKNGNIVVTGDTESINFPTTSGAFDPSHNDDVDVFCFKLKADGSSLLFSTYLGGDGSDYADYDQPPILDAQGNIVITGLAQSSDFPVTAGAFDASYNKNGDAFVLKLANDGKSLIYSTFVGGNQDDHEEALVIDGDGNVIVMGYTESHDIPTTDDAFDTDYNGNQDLFIVKLTANGEDILFGTYLGGNQKDSSYVMTLDQDNNIVISGVTLSSNFPTTPGAFDSSYSSGSGYNVFVTKLAKNGGLLLNSTYLGGSSTEENYALAVNSKNQVLITGRTNSSNYPTTAGAFDTSHNGNYDVYVSELGMESGPALLQKQVAPGTTFAVGYSESLTYTIEIIYPYDVNVVFFDSVPTHTTYVTSSLIAPAGVSFDPISKAITGTLSLLADSSTTITFSTIVQITGTVESAPIISNSACVFPVGAQLKYCEWSNEVINFTYIWPVHLPLILH